MRKIIAIILALILCITCFSGCAVIGVSGDNELPNNRLSITKYLQNKYPDDEITFIEKDTRTQFEEYTFQVAYREYTYKFHSEKYNENFRFFYTVAKSSSYDSSYYDNYCDLLYYDNAKNELKNVLSQIGDCKFYFPRDGVYISNATSSRAGYKDVQTLSEEEWYNSMHLFIGVVFRELPDDFAAFKKKVQTVFNDSKFSSLNKLEVAFCFGEYDDSIDFVDFVFSGNSAPSVNTLRNCEPNDLNLQNIAPYIINLNCAQHDNGKIDFFSQEYFDDNNILIDKDATFILNRIVPKRDGVSGSKNYPSYKYYNTYENYYVFFEEI